MAKLLGAATFLLIVAGGVVTSTGSGLSVPDWPTTYGQNMFAFPVSKWVGNIRFEHSHRLIASAVGFLTIIFLVWTFFARAARPLKTLASLALFAVIVQGVLGGLTVKYLLPSPISVAHACLAQTFFCLTIAIGIVTSRWWSDAGEGKRVEGKLPLDWMLAAFAALYVQLILGAWMRHSNAALAIPDFPASFGRVFPDHWDARIAVHFAHRVWAAAAATIVAVAAIKVRSFLKHSGVSRLAAILLTLLPLQILLGALSIWTRKAVVVTVAHQSTGALLLAFTAGLAVAMFRLGQFAPALVPGGSESSRQLGSSLAVAGH